MSIGTILLIILVIFCLEVLAGLVAAHFTGPATTAAAGWAS